MTEPATALDLRITAPETVAWASDLHLSAEHPAVAQRFFETLTHQAAGVTHLFLLGDLFEAWVGDDTPEPWAITLAERLHALASRGTRVWIMRGNRDFMLDVPLPAALGITPYLARCAATLLPDPCVIDLYGQRTVLTHGDALCTDDQAYQAWRATCRHPIWLQQFAQRPLSERLAMGKMARDNSATNKRLTLETLMDVNQAAVDALLDHTQATQLIHGHTHRPGVHIWYNRLGARRCRIVLTDWSDQRGAWLIGMPPA